MRIIEAGARDVHLDPSPPTRVGKTIRYLTSILEFEGDFRGYIFNATDDHPVVSGKHFSCEGDALKWFHRHMKATHA